PWFDLVGKTMRDDEAAWYSLRLPDYAATVGTTEDGRIVLVKQYRPAVERVTLEVPSGLVDRDERPEEAAVRDLFEETGYKAAEVERLRPLLPDTGRLGNRIWCFTARGLSRAPGWIPESGVEVVLATASELATATATGEFDHALHVAAVLLAQL